MNSSSEPNSICLRTTIGVTVDVLRQNEKEDQEIKREVTNAHRTVSFRAFDAQRFGVDAILDDDLNISSLDDDLQNQNVCESLVVCLLRRGKLRCWDERMTLLECPKNDSLMHTKCCDRCNVPVRL